MKNCAIGQSGGPTAVINASLAGAVAEAHNYNKIDKIYGMINGIEGLLEEHLVEISYIAEDDKKLKMLKTTPSAYLGSCRYKLPNKIEGEIYRKIFDIFDKYNIGYFFYIGGNDSMDTVYRLSEYAVKINSDIKIIGIPKTIDNDLQGTDHTPGYGSAAKYIASAVHEIALDSCAYNLRSVTIVEIMGRDAGWLTAAAALGRQENFTAPHLIYLPESPFNDYKFINDIENLNIQGIKNIIVAISEGIRYANGEYVCVSAKSKRADAFGNTLLSGAGKVLEQLVKEKIGCKTRSVEINVIQRCAAHFTSKTDVDEAYAVGCAAVKKAAEGESGKMMTFNRLSSKPYKTEILSKDIGNIAGGTTSVPENWIINGNDISEDLLNYMRPLIVGEVEIEFENGVPKYLIR